MLSIYVQGTSDLLSVVMNTNNDTGGWLELPEGVAIDMESLAEAWQQNEGIGEFSLPLDLEWTDTNRRILRFAERVENFNKTDNYWICTVFEKGFPEMVNAKLTILNKSGNFNYRKGKFSISIAGTKGIFSSAVKNKKLADFELGGLIDIDPGIPSYRAYAYYHQTTGFAFAPQIRFVPVAIEKFFDDQRNDFDGEFVAMNTVNNVVEDGIGGWSFGRPDPESPTTVITDEANSLWLDYRTVPFLQVKHVVRCIYEESGFSVIGEMVDGTDWDNLLLFNNRSLERYSSDVLGNNDNATAINPKNHVPDILATTFLKAIFNIGIVPMFVDGNNVVLKYFKDDLNTATVANIDDISSDLFESDFADGTARENGYKLSYTADSNDSYFSERVKDISTKTLVARVATIADLATVPSGGLTTDHIVYVSAENMYYQVADATVLPVVWEAWSEALQELTIDKGERQVDLGFDTLATYVLLNETTGLLENKGIVGTRQFGTYYAANGDLVKHPFGLRLFYGTAPGNAAIVPKSFNHNRDAANAITEKYSLSLNADNSIATLIRSFQDVLQNAEVVKTWVMPNSANMELLRNCIKIQKNGVVFLRRKIERSIPLKDDILIELVPL